MVNLSSGYSQIQYKYFGICLFICSRMDKWEWIGKGIVIDGVSVLKGKLQCTIENHQFIINSFEIHVHYII